MTLFYFLIVVIALSHILNFLSYRLLKHRLIAGKQWDLNICCGKTNGGGRNADIVQHDKLPNFDLLDDIYNLPYENDQFNTVLCSHTMEHVEDPLRFFNELQRVGNEITIIIPPLWDIAAVCNFFEHRWIFVTLRKSHKTLPRYIALPFSKKYQEQFLQRIRA